MRNVRGAQKREREWLTREATQRCQVCGRKFILRAERVCSIDCLQKLEAQAPSSIASDRERKRT
jgi:hypothetical protein